MNKLEKHLPNLPFVCISAQNIDDDDDAKNVTDNPDGAFKYKVKEKVKNNLNKKKNVIDKNGNKDNKCKADLHTISEDGHSDKIRRHLPPGSGKYSVGCVDLMDDDHEGGSFCRLFYPVQKTDIFVSTSMIYSLNAGFVFATARVFFIVYLDL